MSTIILGISGALNHDASAALYIDDKLIAAAEEERFRRVKHWAGFPSESIKWCLSEANIGLNDINHISINQDTKANILKKIIRMNQIS